VGSGQCCGSASGPAICHLPALPCHLLFCHLPSAKGRRGKRIDESDVHLPQPQPQKQSSYLIYYIFLIDFLSRFYRVS
jgi:hypothetical protein